MASNIIDSEVFTGIINDIRSKNAKLPIGEQVSLILKAVSKRGFKYTVYNRRKLLINTPYLQRRLYKDNFFLKSNKVHASESVVMTDDDDLSGYDTFLRTKGQSDVNKKYKKLLDDHRSAMELLEVNKDVVRPMQNFSIPTSKSQYDVSVAVALASDWHYEEMVTPESVNFLNSYTLDIADQRIRKFFSNTVKLISKEKKDSKINTLILALLGDFITGNIHEDNIESSQLGVGEALWAVKSRIHAGIQYILDNTDVEILIPCHSGNHGRHTKKQMIANENNNSLEWLMYKSLAEIWHKHKRVKFMVGEAYHSFVEVFPGYTIRFSHGHHVRYGGGVGGVTIPMNKAIAQWNRNRTVSLDCVGHFHQYMDGGNFVVNGALIGYSPYGISVKGAYERPSQAFFLINGKFLEKTCSSKIFLEDK